MTGECRTARGRECHSTGGTAAFRLVDWMFSNSPSEARAWDGLPCICHEVLYLLALDMLARSKEVLCCTRPDRTHLGSLEPAVHGQARRRPVRFQPLFSFGLIPHHGSGLAYGATLLRREPFASTPCSGACFLSIPGENTDSSVFFHATVPGHGSRKRKPPGPAGLSEWPRTLAAARPLNLHYTSQEGRLSRPHYGR